ncbi:hypothetical protein TH66_17650 [Carbonactinospora thermoautotrophica]|uniref:HTH luxR-type domain-containing protein n=1 Tax=Carbonactinospora thermoautotrophica TaxID=1469144 RepID=A0A132MI41_9ACTN|nr:helix-turn-helix transcriptional regulator [Carbonactinospora thermoautotrophica]KWW97463.1 hypothetical protein TH66_17650 [Carbonactinospora thermoautotrophica]KWX08095.1 hypothetical protein TR74_16545 [Carbonactinospora thermoautotrophica]
MTATTTGQEPRAASPELSPLHTWLLRAAARGETIDAIARRTGLSRRSRHFTRIYRALGARNRAHAVALAYRHGHLNPADHEPNTPPPRPDRTSRTARTRRLPTRTTR